VLCPRMRGTLGEQLDSLERAYGSALASRGLDESTVLWRRFLCSDLANQKAQLEDHPLIATGAGASACAVSLVSQPPLPPAKVALWAYHVEDVRTGAAVPTAKSVSDGTLSWRRGELTHLWTTGIVCPRASAQPAPAVQTRNLFERYHALLQLRSLNLAEHVVRTWLFVQDIDANYVDVAAARRAYFAEHGLTADTHFIASTGIEGASVEPNAVITMDAHAIAGLRAEQVAYLQAPEHLSPTHIYGVTFERGTSISYRDRRHVLISGTASIDREGQVVHEGDVGRQVERTLENIEALLGEAGATFNDVAVFIAYVRDPSDQQLVEERLRERFPDTPAIVVVARICRPGWLVEIECQAVVTADAPELPNY
jgi:enamine deaminase RidA (YjgF/YER057c/UK114 family)